ncbi:hypothetical protein [Pseudomonas fluorescens]|uniref:hypothetical protein n=1 Tax=Pseudomonas fluorescens TaxID=294 RepID=UPI003D1A1F93
MQINDTRRILIDLIAQHQASNPSVKLGVTELSKRAGISRQAFNRYYGDLKDYAYGVKPIGDLLIDTDHDRTKDLINQNQASLKGLQQQMSRLNAEHEKEMERTVDSYITSLMINDITLHGANDIRVTLEKQTLYNLDLKKQINQLEIDLSRAKQTVALATAGGKSGTGTNTNAGASKKGEKIKVDVDLGKAYTAYTSTKSLDEYEDKKDIAINAAVRSINKLATDKSCTIVLFAERYICRFAVFFDRYQPTDDSLHIVVRVPIFDGTELRKFVSNLAPASAIHVHIPFMASLGDFNLQRSFFFNRIPEFELKYADAADPITIAMDRIDQVIHFKPKQGD